LEAAGARVLYRESRMFHSIDPVFVHVLQNWLADITQDVPATGPGS
jgi:predicted esterase